MAANQGPYGSDVFKGDTYLVAFEVSAADLSAGTQQYVASPVEGVIESVHIAVQAAIVTGGVIKLQQGSTDVAGATVTVANSATAGTVYTAKSTKASATAKVLKDAAIGINLDAAFNGGGAVRGYVRVTG